MAFNLSSSAPRRAMRGKAAASAADVAPGDRPVDGEEDCIGGGAEELPFPLTLVLGSIHGGGGKRGIFGGSWTGTLFRMCGILFIMATTVLSNGEVLELEILNWIFFVVVSSFSVLFFFAYMSGFLQETTLYFGIFVRFGLTLCFELTEEEFSTILQDHS